MISINDKAKESESETQEDAPPSIQEILGMDSKKEIRTMALFGDVDEEKSLDLIVGMLTLTEFTEKEPPYQGVFE